MKKHTALTFFVCVLFCAVSSPAEAVPARGEILQIIRGDDVSALKEALAGGLNPNGTLDSNGLTLLDAAILSNSFGAVRELADAGADVRAGTPLHTALMVSVNTGNESKRELQGKIIALLLDQGADVNALNEWGDSPLNLAASARNLGFGLEMTRRLIERGANVNAKNDLSLTPLHEAFFVFVDDAPNDGQQPESRAPLVTLLLASGADVHTRSIDGETPLFYALDDLESLKLLLDAGARIDVKNKKGETPFDVALRESPAAVKLLLTQIAK